MLSYVNLSESSFFLISEWNSVYPSEIKISEVKWG